MTDIFPDALIESKALVSHAKKHILDLERDIRSFFDKIPYQEVIDQDSMGKYLTKIKFTEPFIYRFATKMTDVINNLRAALNYTLRGLAVASKAIDLNAYPKFPFAKDGSTFEKNLATAFKKYPTNIITLFRRFKPYEGGDNLLWTLDRIAVTNRYRMLAPVVIGAIKVSGSIESTGKISIIPSPMWNRRKNEIIVFSVTTNGRSPLTIPNLKVSLNIEFDKSVPYIGSKPVIATLNALVEKVEDILETFEGAARALGYIT